jgi:GGDEF domain-containing protein
LDPAKTSLLLLTTSGVRLAEARFSPGVAAELAGAFTKRLRNVLPPNTVIGRWSAEEFVAILNAPAAEAIQLARTASAQLSGSYTCLLEGRVVRPDLQVRVAVVEPAEGGPERLLARVREFLTEPLEMPV